MIDRRKFVTTGLTAAAIAAAGRAAQAQVTGAGADHNEHNGHGDSVHEACAQACSDCQRECNACATHCAKQVADGHKQHMTTLMTCQDCADVCVAAAQIVSRGGPFSKLICRPCAEACAECAKECERFPDDKHMAQCAEECRKCEKACREMVA